MTRLDSEIHPSSIATRPFRVLIIAEACNPEWTSVPLVGWSHYQALARRVKAHLVTQVRNRDALVKAGLIEGVDFTAIDSERVAGPAHWVGEKLRGGSGRGWTTKMLFNRFGRVYFERLVRKQFGPRLRAGEFDVVHQITPLSPTLPARMAKVCAKAGVPFVWGPLNGGLAWPRGFEAAMRNEKEFLSRFRGVYRWLPGFRASRTHASAILIGSAATFEQMPRRFHAKCLYLPENAIDSARFNATRTRIATKPIRICFLGRLVPYKGADLLIDAAEPLLRSGDVTIDLIGDGPQRAELETMLRDRAIPNVTLVGQVHHAALQERLVGYDVLGFPSIREFGGAVALEAMALGVVPIVPDYGGLGELVTDSTGWRVPMGSRSQLVERFRTVLESIIEDPSRLADRSNRAVRRAREQFTWDAKAVDDLRVYTWVTGRAPKPEFSMPVPDLNLSVV